MKKISKLLLVAPFVLLLVSCGKKTKDKYYNVSFYNDDNTLIKTISVKEGDTPIYDGETPTKKVELGYECEFLGWDSNFTEVHSDTKYTATYSDKVVKEGMKGFTFESTNDTCVIKGLKDETVETITIPDYVTSIGERAFYMCRSLKEITIPDSVTSIGAYSFSFCESLKDVELSNSLTTISQNAFMFCQSLESITLPNNLTTIDDDAFLSCRGLKKIIIPNSVTSIGENAFSGCEVLSEVTLSNSLTSLGKSAFSYCSVLRKITIPSSLISLEESVFSNCIGLTEIKIPISIKNIGDSVFNNCPKLSMVLYEGLQIEWSKITIGSNNSQLDSATIFYGYIDE